MAFASLIASTSSFSPLMSCAAARSETSADSHTC
jgi:hypothetical protein